jgi:hypothetical protein
MLDNFKNQYEELQQWFDDNPETEGHEADYPQFMEMNILFSKIQELEK